MLQGVRGFVKSVQAFWVDESGQVSAEMLIVTAAVVSVALLLVSQLQSAAHQGKDVLSKQAADAFKEIKSIK